MLTVAFAGILFSGCKKDNKNAAAITVAKIAGVYVITDMKLKVGNQESDIFKQLTPCAQRDTYGFGADGTFQFGGAVDQNCADDDYTGTWSLSDNIITIERGGTNGTSTMAISSLTSTQVVVTYINSQGNLTTTLTRQ